MPGDKPVQRALEPHVDAVEPSEREGRILARASGIAAAIALASIGLAYVAAQAGIAQDGRLSGDGPSADLSPRVSAEVPEVDSPSVESDYGDGAVLVREDPEELTGIRPPVALAVDDEDDATGAGDSEPVHAGGGTPPAAKDEDIPSREGGVRDDDPAVDPEPAPAPVPDPGEEPEPGSSEWSLWWDEQRDAWEDAWDQLWNPGLREQSILKLDVPR